MYWLRENSLYITNLFVWKVWYTLLNMKRVKAIYLTSTVLSFISMTIPAGPETQNTTFGLQFQLSKH